MITVDTRGMLCPQPLIVTKRAIAGLEVGEKVEVIYDNSTAKDNLISFLHELGIEAQLTSTNQGDTAICFTITQEPKSAKLPEDSQIVCPVPEVKSTAQSSNYVVAVRSNVMGEGDKKLGAILLRAFINTLPDSSKELPAKILLYNSGVDIAIEGIDTVESLRRLEEMGVEIIACGTCLDFYGVKDRLAVGRVGNMLDIAQGLIDAHHVIYL